MNSKPDQREMIESITTILEQGRILLSEIGDEFYTRKLPLAFDASIGGHYRHCLDHFRTLLEAAHSGDLNYDHRARGTIVETDRFAALNVTNELHEAFTRLDPDLLSRPVLVTCKTSYATSGSQSSPSTIGREVMYTVAHAVHHYALIGIMAGIMGLKLPAGFGVAPSTVKYQSEIAGRKA